MTTDEKPRYWFGMRTSLPYAQVVERVKLALKEQGFGVLTEIDVQTTLKQKLDVEYRPYVILGACNPPLAHRALSAEPEIGVLLPCNVIIYEDRECTVVDAMDPLAVLGLTSNPVLEEVAQEVACRLKRALSTLDQAVGEEQASREGNA